VAAECETANGHSGSQKRQLKFLPGEHICNCSN
jgi:hypothetical protein